MTRAVALALAILSFASLLPRAIDAGSRSAGEAQLVEPSDEGPPCEPVSDRGDAASATIAFERAIAFMPIGAAIAFVEDRGVGPGDLHRARIDRPPLSLLRS